MRGGTLFGKIVDIVLANLSTVGALIVIAFFSNLARTLIGLEPYSGIVDFLNVFAGIVSIFTVVSISYRERQTHRQRETLRQALRAEISRRFQEVEEATHDLIGLPPELVEVTIDRTFSRFWPEYQLSQNVDSNMEFEMISSLFDEIKRTRQLREGVRMLLEYVYLSKYAPVLVTAFFNRLDKSKLDIEGTPEWEFARLQVLWQRGQGLKVSEMLEEITSPKKEEVDASIAGMSGQSALYKKILEKSESERRLLTLQRLLARFMGEGYVSSTGLLSLVRTEHDILCIMKFEGGLSSSLKMFKDGIERTPFKKVLLDLGFIQPSRREYFTFLLPIDRLPERYRLAPKDFVEEVIIPRVRQEWNELAERYSFRRLQKPTFAYIAFVIKRHEVLSMKFNMRFTRDLENLMGSISPQDAARVLISQLHRIPVVMRRMELDSLLDHGSDRLKEGVRQAEPEIREALRKDMGFEIVDITDYRRLKDQIEEFSNILMTKTNEVLPTLEYRRKLGEQMARLFAEEIVLNAEDLDDLIRTVQSQH
jgi:hypothetical protein